MGATPGPWRRWLARGDRRRNQRQHLHHAQPLRLGFVQVIQGSIPDAEQSWALGGRSGEARPLLGPGRVALAGRMSRLAGRTMPTLRPDLIGGVIGFDPHDDTLTEAVYFTSESAAREGERKPLPADVAALAQEWLALVPDPRYYDLTEPWLYSPPS